MAVVEVGDEEEVGKRKKKKIRKVRESSASRLTIGVQLLMSLAARS